MVCRHPCTQNTHAHKIKITSTIKKKDQWLGARRVTVGKALAFQVQNLSSVLRIPVLGRCRQEAPWGSLAS